MTDNQPDSHLDREERRIEPIDLSDWKVLIVDDQPDNIKVVELALNFHGTEVKTARNGIKAFEVMETYKPNLILLDLSMPEMDGWTMFKKLQEMPEYADIPVIAITAHAMLGDREKVMNAGFNGYIAKPFSVPTIVEDITTILEKGSADTE